MKWIPDTPDFDIRYSNLKELEYLQRWMLPEEIRRWYPVSTDKDIEEMTKNWIGFSKFSASLTAFYQERPVGIATLFLMPYRKLIHHALVYFIVDPEQAGQGVGTSLVKNITHLGKVYFRFEKVHVEVYEGCPAISILQKQGYQEMVRQENYVKENQSHYLSRIILEKKL